jgi:xylan 1,4-beta-xylosidase
MKKFNPNECYLNPIFAGDYPDPSILQDGYDYYVVHSSFEYYPGLLIWHSRDLINWTPVDLEVGNIDPGHITDATGKRYLYFSNGGYVPLADDGLSVTGKSQACYSGWSIPREWTIECFCLEGPKLVKRGDYYYLTVAEGGTAGPATGHMAISARSKSPLGPWENSPYNPVSRTDETDSSI